MMRPASSPGAASRLHRLILPALLLAGTGCAAIQQVAALRQVAFSLSGVSGARLAGVSLDRIASWQDLSVTDAARLGLAVARDEFPLEFTLGVRAANPVENRSAATMVRMGWTLLLNDSETISGVLDSSHTIQPGDTVTIPVRMKLDLREFFDGGAEQLVNVATSLVGSNADPARVALQVIPRVDTPVGPITYPVPIRATIGGRSAQ